MDNYPILENKSPKLCTDRLDGILHTCYIWLHTHSLEQIKEVYDDIIVLKNEDGMKEIGFKSQKTAEKFVSMVMVYAKELQENTDKYVMGYISEIVKLAFKRKLISLNDLYVKKEAEIVDILAKNFTSWKDFNKATALIRTDVKPDNFYISFDTKKRTAIPLVRTKDGNMRITDISDSSKELYLKLKNFHDTKFAYVETILGCE